MGYPDMMRDIAALARREAMTILRKTLETLPIVDASTGLYNKTYFELRLEEEMARSHLYGCSLSLIFIDLGASLRDGREDRIRINDKIMKAAAAIIHDCLVETIGIASVYERSMFTIIMPEATIQETAVIVENILGGLLRENLPGAAPRIGAAQYGAQEGIDEFVRAAVEALHDPAGN
jgi:diguanylate cyclase (GGDEF)-like protein